MRIFDSATSAGQWRWCWDQSLACCAPPGWPKFSQPTRVQNNPECSACRGFLRWVDGMEDLRLQPVEGLVPPGEVLVLVGALALRMMSWHRDCSVPPRLCRALRLPHICVLSDPAAGSCSLSLYPLMDGSVSLWPHPPSTTTSLHRSVLIPLHSGTDPLFLLSACTTWPEIKTRVMLKIRAHKLQCNYLVYTVCQ